MKDPYTEDDAETEAPVDAKPAELTPEGLALMKRARRSFGISISVLLLGFMAIGAALVYRATRDDSKPVGSYVEHALAVPAGAEVVSAASDNGTVTITYKLGGATQVRIYDAEGKITGQFDIVTE